MYRAYLAEAWSLVDRPGIWPSFCMTVLLLALSAYAWRRRGVPGASSFAIGSVFSALWTAGSFMELAAVDVGTKILWFKFQAVWQVPATTAIACFVLEYAWPGRWLTRRNLALLSIAPLTFLVLILTDDLHHLVWYGFAFDGLVAPLRAPANWFFVAYVYAMSLVELAVFIWLFLRSPQHRWPVSIMMTGQLGGRVAYMLEAVEVVHSNLPVDVLVIAYLFLSYAVALFGFGIFDPIALARKTVIAQIRDGILVLDARQLVASLNPAAQAILGVPAKSALGRPIQDLMPPFAKVTGGALQEETSTSTEISLGTGRDARDYVLVTSELKDWRGHGIGQLLLLRDVSDQKQAQAQIVEQQRSLATLQERERLARELHDSVGQTLAAARLQASTVRLMLARGETAQADKCLEQMAAMSVAAEDDVREYLLGARTSLSADLSFFPALREYTRRFCRQYSLQIELSVPPQLESRGLDPTVEMQLLRIIQEALSNARKHACATNAQVTFTLSGTMMQVTIADDGQGFDPEAVAARCAEGFGLQAMRERAEGLGGALQVDSAPGQGTRVMVQVPAGEIRGPEGMLR
ncbi:MAG: histidine kinase [Anaerolineae bacterium]|nr:histidine kinase [Anaerolineae bacterium]